MESSIIEGKKKPNIRLAIHNFKRKQSEQQLKLERLTTPVLGIAKETRILLLRRSLNNRVDELKT